ncbi:MAG TPA: ATP-grasp domain-containing protein [Vicinamibacterales bacterium]|nr:ATP-grasp domain-containing protein [Vicinamibacterales bacterium]
MKRLLLLATTTGYQTRMFADAAARLGVELVYATDRCDQLDDPWRDNAIAVRFHEEWRSVDAVLKAVDRKPVHAVLALGDRPTVMAAYLSRLLGLPGNPPEAAVTSRDKRLTRNRLKAAGLPTPAYRTVPITTDAAKFLGTLSFPVVVKPTVLSGSRGVIRADDALSFVTAFDRVRRLLMSHEVRELHDPEADVIHIEQYIAGAEYAVEAVMDNGRLRVLAIFDKPDPLDGPFFEETIYVTPSRATEDRQTQIAQAVADGAKAIGLVHGPIHAECRVNAGGVYVLEIAARPIGGLCAKSLRFERPDLTTPGPRDVIGFEEFLLRQALGEDMTAWQREAQASAVMMIPIPKSGVYRRVEGVEAASAVDGVTDVQITAKPDQQLLALPEGASYLGFIFARAATPEAAERAVRDAHARLRFTIDPLLALLGNEVGR